MNQQATLQWVAANPVPKDDKTLYLVNAVVREFGMRKCVGDNKKWVTNIFLADNSGEMWVDVWDGKAGQMPQSYLGHTVAFNLKGSIYKGNSQVGGFWELDKAAIPPSRAATPPPMGGGATPSPAMRQDLPVFDKQGQPMSLVEAQEATGREKSVRGGQTTPDSQDRRDRGVAVLALASFLATSKTEITVDQLIIATEQVFNYIKTGTVAISEPDEPQIREPGEDEIPSF